MPRWCRRNSRQAPTACPSLDDPIEARRAFFGAIAPEPSFLDHSAAGRRRRLLILAGEIVLAHVDADSFQRFERFALRVKRRASHSRERLAAEGRLDEMLFGDFGERREGDDLLLLLLENMADQIVLVQPLHDDDDRAANLIVEA
jgi:hypothetical protein